MKIAFHFPTLASGGVEKMRIALARELIVRGVSVDFVLCQARGEYLDQVPAGVELHDLNAPRTRNSLLPLVRYLKRHKPDHLISSLGPQNVVAVLAKKLSGTATRIHVTQHNALTRQAESQGSIQQRLIPIAYRWALPRADTVIAVSAGIAQDIDSRTGYPSADVEVIYNPAYTHLPSTIPPLPEWLIGKRYVLSIGRMVDQKAFDDLIRAFNIVQVQHPDLHLVILGVGPRQESLRTLSSELGLGDKVHLPGFASNPTVYLQNAELFALSSRYEGFGNVLVEALSAGIPVVSTDCDFGPNEILTNGKFGILTPVGDINLMAEAIDATLTNSHDSEQLKARAREFSVEAIVDRYLSVLRKA